MGADGGTALPATSITRGGNELRLEVVERNGDDFVLEARVRVRHFGAAAACNLSREELLAWRRQLAAVHETLSGEAALRQERFHLTLRADRGRVDVEGELDSESGWGNGERAVLRFRLPPVDQTDVAGVLEMLDTAAEMQPTVHEDE